MLDARSHWLLFISSPPNEINLRLLGDYWDFHVVIPSDRTPLVVIIYRQLWPGTNRDQVGTITNSIIMKIQLFQVKKFKAPSHSIHAFFGLWV